MPFAKYEDRLKAARTHNLTKRVAMREIDGKLAKVDAALATQRVCCVATAPTSAGLARRDDNAHRCPAVYEADAIDFSDKLGRAREFVKRCAMCTRALHPLFDIHARTCSFCARHCS
ncbi:hypothetical protein [Orgyia pseudotsugata single capsid nuclopolyhedrovirus]|nr:hypothetical protein [Orgyia pseudotsugata single capsid nuclopolyhedrovirus]